MSESLENKTGLLDKSMAVEFTKGYDWDFILDETNLTKTRIKELIRYYSRLPLEIQLDVLQRQADDYENNKDKWRRCYTTKATEARYCQLINAINEQYAFEHQQKRKQACMNESELAKLTSQRMQRLQQSKGRKNKKFSSLEQRRFVLRQLRQQGASWRDIQLYLQKYHKITVSHSYIQRVYSLFFDSNDQEIA